MCYKRYAALLLCLSSFTMNGGGSKPTKKKPTVTSTVPTQRVLCEGTMSATAFKLMIANVMKVNPAQITIIFNEKDISAETRSLQELGITPKSQPSIVIQSAPRKKDTKY